MKKDKRPRDQGERPLKWGEATGPGATDEIDEECLGDIVHSVSSHNRIEVVSFPETFKESVADDAQLLLDVALWLLFRMEDRQRHGPLCTEFAYEFFVTFRIAPAEGIVYVSYSESEAMFFAEPHKYGEEGDTVWSARNSDDDFRTTRQEMVFCEGILKTTNKNQSSVSSGQFPMRGETR